MACTPFLWPFCKVNLPQCSQASPVYPSCRHLDNQVFFTLRLQLIYRARWGGHSHRPLLLNRGQNNVILASIRLAVWSSTEAALFHRAGWYRFFFFYMETLSIAFGIRICLSYTLRTTQHIMLEDTQCEKSLTWVQDDESSIVLDMYRTEHVNFLCSVIKCTYLDGLDLYTWTSAAPL